MYRISLRTFNKFQRRSKVSITFHRGKTGVYKFVLMTTEILSRIMLSSLDALAGKISPGSGKSSPTDIRPTYKGGSPGGVGGCGSILDSSFSKLNHFNHNNIHPYQKPKDHNCVKEK